MFSDCSGNSAALVELRLLPILLNWCLQLHEGERDGRGNPDAET